MENKWIDCYKCNRGGNGNDNDKCSCGWKHTEENGLGCYLGVPIKGKIKPKPKISRSKARYQRFLEYSDWFDSFREFLTWDAKPEREWNRLPIRT